MKNSKISFKLYIFAFIFIIVFDLISVPVLALQCRFSDLHCCKNHNNRILLKTNHKNYHNLLELHTLNHTLKNGNSIKSMCRCSKDFGEIHSTNKKNIINNFKESIYLTISNEFTLLEILNHDLVSNYLIKHIMYLKFSEKILNTIRLIC